MCKYCKEDYYTTMNSSTRDYSGIDIDLNCRTATLRVRVYMFKDMFDTQDVVSINYCPMCGRKLTK